MSKKKPAPSSSLQDEHPSSISLTTFPTPRNQESIGGGGGGGGGRKDHISLGYFSQEESRLGNMGTIPRSTGTTSSVVTIPPTSSKQYWMPDHLCKVCYDCGSSFSLFKRRHHCRLCGQIFCYQCSSHFIDGTRHGFNGNIRVCNFCFNYSSHGAPASASLFGSPTQRQLLVRQQQQQQRLNNFGSTRGDGLALTVDGGTVTNGTDLELSIPSSPSLLSPLVNSPSSRTFDGLETSDPLPLQALQQQLLQQQQQQQRQDNSPPINVPTTKASTKPSPGGVAATNGSPSINTNITSDKTGDVQKPTNTPPTSRIVMPRRRRSSAELLDAIESTVDPLESSNLSDTSVMSEKDSNEQQDFGAQSDPELLEKHLKVAQEHIHVGVESLCTGVQDLLESKNIDPIWFQKEVEEQSLSVVKNILSSMKFRSSNGFNFQHLVKVKAITTTSIYIPNLSSPTTSPRGREGGRGRKGSNPTSPKGTNREETKPSKSRLSSNGGSAGIASNLSIEILPGTLCRKNLCHKQMPRHILNPRVLLLAGGISYDRTFDSGKLSSLDTLIEQEKSYMSILVDKISQLKPHVIFVGHTVSRYAQEFLKERGVALVVNVKSEILERIARHTGAEILTSTDHVDKSNPDQVLGTCRLFQVKNLPLVPEPAPPAAPTPPSSDSSTSGAPSTPVASDIDPQGMKRGDSLGTSSGKGGISRPAKTSEAFLFLEGCDPSNGFTILLKGAFPKSQLQRIKEVLNKALAFIYEQLLEAHVLAALDLPIQSVTSKAETQRVLDVTKCMLRLQEQNNIKQKYVQCMMPNPHHFQMYTTDKDLSLGHFILEEIHSFQVKCANTKCNYVLMDHVKTFHLAKRPILMLSFEELPPDRKRLQLLMSSASGGTLEDTEIIVFWRWCKECRALVSPFRRLDAYAHKFSFARSLELLFLPLEPMDRRIKRSGSRESQDQHQPEIVKCQHQAESSHVMFFSRDKSVVRLEYLRDTQGKPSYTSRLLVHAFDHEANIAQQEELDAKEEEYVAGREETLRLLLEQVTMNFRQQIRQAQQMVELPTEEQEDVEEVDETTGLLMLELMCLYKSIDRDGNFLERKIGNICKMDQEDIDNATGKNIHSKHASMRKKRLRRLNYYQREIYLFACQWMRILCNLQRTFKKRPAISSSTAALAISGATSVVSKMTSALLSPVLPPKALAPPMNYSTESDVTEEATELEKELADEPVPSINGRDDDLDEAKPLVVSSLITKGSSAMNAPPASTSSVSSTATTAASSDVWSASTTHSNETTSECSKSSSVPRWRSALGELHRMLGRGASDAETDDFLKFELSFPSELATGHPSLPFSYKATNDDKISSGSYVLVTDAEPITLVAYSLCSKQYEEEMDSMKLVVHEEVVAAADAVTNNTDESKKVAGTNWARAALITGSLTSHFKFSIMDVPTHARILSGKDDTVQDWSKVMQQRRLSDSTSNSASFSSILALSSELTCKAYYPLQFEVLRQLFYGAGSNESFSLAIANVKEWITGGGKSGATFFRSYDDRFVIKHITVTEMQSFLDVLPEYFKYMASIAFDGVDSALSKTVGLYHTTILNRETGYKQHNYIAVLENVFYGKQVDQIYDLKGSSRNRYVKKSKRTSPSVTTTTTGATEGATNEEVNPATSPTSASQSKVDRKQDTVSPENTKGESNKEETQNKEPKLGNPVLLDGNFLEYTTGYPLGVDMNDHKKFLKAIKNDTAFLSSINIVDYSMIVGFDYENGTNPSNMTVGIIDYMRQFDFMKRMESVGKSVGMIAGQASPTIIEPALYSKRFVEAMQRYFMPVSSMPLRTEGGKSPSDNLVTSNK